MATSAFLPAYGGHLSSPLRQAVFWLHLRQEIDSACSHQRTVRADLENCSFESLDHSLDVDIWLHRSLWICAQTLQWAYGDENSSARWRELCRLIEEWLDKRPSSFDPLFFRPRDPSQKIWFPEITFASDEHGESCLESVRVNRITAEVEIEVVATHYLYLAKLLLTAHDPKIPRVGPQMKSAVAEMNVSDISILGNNAQY